MRPGRWHMSLRMVRHHSVCYFVVVWQRARHSEAQGEGPCSQCAATARGNFGTSPSSATRASTSTGSKQAASTRELDEPEPEHALQQQRAVGPHRQRKLPYPAAMLQATSCPTAWIFTCLGLVVKTDLILSFCSCRLPLCCFWPGRQQGFSLSLAGRFHAQLAAVCPST